MGMPMCFFVTPIHSLQCGMSSILAATTNTVLDTVVQIVEYVGRIEPTATLREVLQKVTEGSPCE